VKGKAIVGIAQSEADTDKLQSHLEQIIKTYISPMPQIYVVGFKAAAGEQWGAIVIPPRSSKPYMFFKDLQCIDPKRSRKRGEWFVRRGSTTDHGLPEDLAIITQRQTDQLLEPLRESVRNLQLRIAKTEEQYNSALFKLVERAVSALPAGIHKSEDREEFGTEIGEALGMDLSAQLKQKLRGNRFKARRNFKRVGNTGYYLPSKQPEIAYSRNSAGSPLLIAERTLAIRHSRSPKSDGSMGS
jgi:hypothetical protein